MTDPLFLTRVTLKREAGAVAPLLGVLAPDDPDEATAIAHRLMWTLMPEGVQRAHNAAGAEGGSARAPFLWRSEQQDNRFYVLGPRPIQDSPYFHVETKAFEPDLREGDRLSFTLRVNATVDRKVGTDANGRPVRKRSDVAMDLMHTQERDADGTGSPPPRAERRNAAAERAAAQWLQAQGARYGFALKGLSLQGYRPTRLPGRGRRASVGVLDTTGLVEVSDPDAFLAKLAGGFGRAKAFGCGLMLIRRAS